jgi:hypothetical protein
MPSWRRRTTGEFQRDHHKVGAAGVHAGWTRQFIVVSLPCYERALIHDGSLSAPRLAVRDLAPNLAPALGAQGDWLPWRSGPVPWCPEGAPRWQREAGSAPAGRAGGGRAPGPDQAAEAIDPYHGDAVSCVATVPATRLPTGAVLRKTRLYKLRMRPRFSSSTIVWRIGNSNGICAPPRLPPGAGGPPRTPRRQRRSGLQPGRARCSATVAGAGQAAQDGGERRRINLEAFRALDWEYSSRVS